MSNANQALKAFDILGLKGKKVTIQHPTDPKKDQFFYVFESISIPVKNYDLIREELVNNVRRVRHVTELQQRGTELLLENRRLKEKFNGLL